MVVRLPCTLPALFLASAMFSPTTHDPSSAGTAINASAGAVSTAKPPRPMATSGATRWGARPSIVARSEAASRSRARDVASVCESSPDWSETNCSAASVMVCQPVHRHRWARSACSTLAVARPALRSRASRRTTMPGVQNPHWLPPVAHSASPHAAARLGSSPSIVVIDRFFTRRAGVTHDTRGCPSTSTVQQPHWPCGLQPSLTDRIPAAANTSSRVWPDSTNVIGVPSTVSSSSTSAASGGPVSASCASDTGSDESSTTG